MLTRLLSYQLTLIVVLLTGCASTVPPKILVPAPDETIMPYFENGVPFAQVTSDSARVLLTLEPTTVAGDDYMHVWALYENTSGTPYLFQPLKFATMNIIPPEVAKKEVYDTILPESPTKMLAHIDNRQAISLISEAIGGTLEALSTQPTTVTGENGEQYTLDDKTEKVLAVVGSTTASMAQTVDFYQTFKNSLNSGILRRHTVFPGQSVNGFIYFPLPNLRSRDGSGIDKMDCGYRLEVVTPTGNHIVNFISAEGE